jgi:hypothetical protein
VLYPSYTPFAQMEVTCDVSIMSHEGACGEVIHNRFFSLYTQGVVRRLNLVPSFCRVAVAPAFFICSGSKQKNFWG